MKKTPYLKIEPLVTWSCQSEGCYLEADFKVTLEDGKETLRCPFHLQEFTPDQPFARRSDE